MIRSLAPSHNPYFGGLTNSSLSAALCLAGLYSMSWVPSTGAQTVSPSLTKETNEATEAAEDASHQQLRDRLQRLQEGARAIPNLPTSTPSGAESSGLIARFPSLGSAILDVQLAGYMAYVESLGTPDILIVGSSRALQGIDPEALSDRLSEQGYDGLRVYNFSVNGATAQVVSFILSELLPGELPPVVVWGDGSRAFNEGRRDRTWEAILASPGYRAIQNGERPLIADLTVNTSDSAEDSRELAATDLAAAPLTNEAALLNRLRNNISRSAASASTADLGVEPRMLAGLGLDALGFSAIATQFDPWTYYQEFPKVNGQYDGAYSPFVLQGEQTVALAEVSEFVRSQSTQLVFINLPLSDSYLDDFRLYHESQFQRFLQVQGTEHQFEVIDLLQAWPNQPELFADPSHINQDGASAIAAQIALEPSLLSALTAIF